MAVGFVAVGAYLLLGNACSLVFNTSEAQCNSVADCQSRGGAFANSVCGEDHVCKVDATVACATNKQCLDTFGGQPYFCRQTDHQCVQLTSPDCQKVLFDGNDLANDNTIFLGVLAPLTLTSPNQVLGIGAVNGIDLARGDIKQSLADLPSAKPNGDHRPLVFVVCDEERDLNNKSYLDAAKHLAVDVQVPAIIGGFSSGIDLSVLTTWSLPKNVLQMSFGNTSDAFTTQPKGNPPMYIRSSPANTYLGVADAVLFTSHLEATLKGPPPQGNVPSGQPVRVMTVNKGDTYGQSLAAAILAHVTFNSKSAQANASAVPPTYKQHDYGTNITAGDPQATQAFAAAATDIDTFLPHVVLMASTGEARTIMSLAEKGWTNASYRPRWIFLAGQQQGPELLKLYTDDDFRQRVMGLSFDPGAENPNYAAFALRYGSKHNTNDLTQDGYPFFFSASAFDQVYVAAMAIIGLGDQPVTGPNMAAAIKKLVPVLKGGTGTTKIPNDPTNLAAMVAAVQQGGVDMDGASSALDFDLTTGDNKTDVHAWCGTCLGSPTCTPGNAFADIDGYYEGDDGTVHGSYFSCFDRDAGAGDGG